MKHGLKNAPFALLVIFAESLQLLCMGFLKYNPEILLHVIVYLF